MNINLGLAKREFVLQKNITNQEMIKNTYLIFRDVNKKNQAVFDAYVPGASFPESWALEKYDANNFAGLIFPKGERVDPITVTSFINRRTNMGIAVSDIAFVDAISPTRYQVMISLDSMYFTQSFILQVA